MTKKVFTTGEIARILGININTVIKWFDEGKIKGFRLPTSNDRRIPLAALKAFMAENSIPMDLLEEDTPMRRLHKRVPITNEVKLTVVNGGIMGAYKGALSNISLGGACVVIPGRQDMAIPTSDFKVLMHVVDGPLSGSDLSAKVVHLMPAADKLQIGMMFNETAPEQVVRIQRFVEAQAV